jgi:hypothetical protein
MKRCCCCNLYFLLAMSAYQREDFAGAISARIVRFRGVRYVEHVSNRLFPYPCQLGRAPGNVRPFLFRNSTDRPRDYAAGLLLEPLTLSRCMTRRSTERGILSMGRGRAFSLPRGRNRTTPGSAPNKRQTVLTDTLYFLANSCGVELASCCSVGLTGTIAIRKTTAVLFQTSQKSDGLRPNNSS